MIGILNEMIAIQANFNHVRELHNIIISQHGFLLKYQGMGIDDPGLQLWRV